MRLMSILVVSLLLPLSAISNEAGNEAKEFINKLKDHYKDTLNIDAFSLTHRYFGRSDPYLSWDFKFPSRYQAFKVTDIDLSKRHYYQNVVHHFSGGLYLDEVHFQNDNHSYRYEKNGLILGKSVVAQKMTSFERYTNLTLMNLDFLAVRALLSEQNIRTKIEMKPESRGQDIRIIHQYGEGRFKEYVFSKQPLRLLSIYDRARNRTYLYNDYRTRNGLTFAHVLLKHYDGDTTPSFITRIEQFQVIKRIEPEKLTLPSDFYLAPSKVDEQLTISKIDESTYLVSDAQARNQTLLKMYDNNIMVSGSHSSKRESKRIIKLIGQKFPTKKITLVHVTHPHRSQIAGLLPYIELDAKVLADSYTVSAIKAYPPFANSLDLFGFKTIEHGQNVYGIRFYVLENMRAKRQSFAYLNESGVIFQSDFFPVAFDNTSAKILPSYSAQFVEFILSKKLNVKRVIATKRNAFITAEMLNRALTIPTL